MLCLQLEEKEQLKRFHHDEKLNLRTLKSEGLALHPIRVSRKQFGYADYPEISFRIPFPIETGNFRDGIAIECFCAGEEPVKGLLLNIDGKSGEFRLFAPDFPDWIEDEGVGIKLCPDTRTFTIMKKGLDVIKENLRLSSLFNQIHSEEIKQHSHSLKQTEKSTEFRNPNLNESQKSAVDGILNNENMLIVHGPPGTGKTTTLVEAIIQLTDRREKILVSAPSNTAVDNIATYLIDTKVNFLRVGNNSKVNERIFPFTPEGMLKENKKEKEIKKLKIRAEELRKMANQYKRRFGKDERDQRNLLMKEVRNLRTQIKEIQQYNEIQLFENAQVILGTPIGLNDAKINDFTFHTLIIDEAGQCLEPLAWCIFPLADKIILAGDHLQLPPTVLSDEAAHLGLNRSILEICFLKFASIYLLNTQYRMRESISQFSSNYFYEGKLQTSKNLISTGDHIHFFDTAGAGFEEEHGSDGVSLINKGELDVVLQIIEKYSISANDLTVISPYSGQVSLARDILPSEIKISTIDSIQGQEKHTIILSLVRSNSLGQIGFLKDYRRMNVALTRAREQLFVIGDSSTLGKDPFYAQFFDYIEKINAYKSIWEIMYS